MTAIGAQTDFNTIMTERGESVNWHVNTETKDGQSGDPIDSYGSATSISVIIVRIPKAEIYNSMGTLTNEHFNMYAKSTRAISIHDKIVRSSTDYKVEDILDQAQDAGTNVYNKYLLRRIVGDA